MSDETTREEGLRTNGAFLRAVDESPEVTEAYKKLGEIGADYIRECLNSPGKDRAATSVQPSPPSQPKKQEQNR